MKNLQKDFAFINVRLLKRQKDILKELASRKGLSISAYIRMIIIDEIEIISRRRRK